MFPVEGLYHFLGRRLGIEVRQKNSRGVFSFHRGGAWQEVSVEVMKIIEREKATSGAPFEGTRQVDRGRAFIAASGHEGSFAPTVTRGSALAFAVCFRRNSVDVDTSNVCLHPTIVNACEPCVYTMRRRRGPSFGG